MSGRSMSSLRIDWFDCTLTEEIRPHASTSAAMFTDEEPPDPQATAKPTFGDRKPIGFKRLLDFSLLKPPILNLEIAHRPGFWNLLETKLKGDFIVLIVKILATIYMSLESEEKSKIAAMLRTKFKTSNFLEVLKEYLKGLPSVRIVEKRMNSHLWDDVQSFYFDVVALSEGIFNFGENSNEYLESLYDLLEITETSAIGVREEHTETFSDQLFEQIVQLKSKIMPFIKKVTTIQQKTFSGYLFELVVQLIFVIKQFVYKKLKQEEQVLSKNMKGNLNQKPEREIIDISFKNLSIFPSKDDLLQGNNIKILPNLIDGAYPSVAHYLDLQFKLLREDCFGPLREGICKYIENPSKKRHENIRVYPNVRVLRIYISNNRVGHLVDIMRMERMTSGQVDCKKYRLNKQLMFGSLLFFTADNFQTILCATVLDSSLNLLSEGYMAVSFQNPIVSEEIFSKPYLMVESEVFFEPYHQVLKVVQKSSLLDLPMRKYIVDVQKETLAPAYLTPTSLYTTIDLSNNTEITFPVLTPAYWPVPSVIGLDNSQMEAYTFALTREFAVIQGPPGTGKTFIGIKIASTLLRNLSLEGTPMLIVCYTNHALDQFLEGILNVTTNIVRLGGQSKSKALEDYTLYKVRSRMKSKHSKLYASKRSELENISRKMSDLQTEIEKCEKEIISYKSVKTYLKVELKCRKGTDPILSWLFGHLENDKENLINDDGEDDDWEKQADYLDCTFVDDFSNLNTSTKLESSFSETWALKEIDSLKINYTFVNEMTEDPCEIQKITKKFNIHVEQIRMRLDYFRRKILIAQYDQVSTVVVKVKDVYQLPPEERWNVYFSAVGVIKRGLMNKLNNLVEQHNSCSSELAELSDLTDGEVLKMARVVGVTTTTAAKRHDLMNILKPPIVIAEEAAEVLEAHIVASLTHSCQHLILIGDHKQLRPTAAHYELAKDYNLEISLFERMIRNGVHARTLTTQRRMRPNFAELLVPVIYERLDAHPCVYQYEDVRGMNDNLFFYSHDVFEDPEISEDSWSHKHTLEAKWCASLANYLCLVGHRPEHITLLVTYTDQATLVKELSKKYTILQDMKITSVDNYQGEENEIVILSLVRSNKEGNIGFLKAANRICVALSRAKQGFYMFGNMGVLKAASSIWRYINSKLEAQNAVGNQLTLRCQMHETTLVVTTPNDLDNSYRGECLRICESKIKSKNNLFNHF